MTIAICHDSNHNGDDDPTKGCGNPECFKHQPGNSPPPERILIWFCECDFCESKRETDGLTTQSW